MNIIFKQKQTNKQVTPNELESSLCFFKDSFLFILLVVIIQLHFSFKSFCEFCISNQFPFLHNIYFIYAARFFSVHCSCLTSFRSIAYTQTREMEMSTESLSQSFDRC